MVEKSTETSAPMPTVRPTAVLDAERHPSAAEQAWERNTLEPTLAKSPERDADFTTVSNYPIRRLYTEADLPNWDPENELGYPGQPPYTRGIHATMYRGRLWTMRQFAGFGTAQDTNERFRYLLSQGQTGLSVAFDLPTLMGTTPTIHSPRVKSESAVWRSVRWRTWKCCSTGFPGRRDHFDDH